MRYFQVLIFLTVFSCQECFAQKGEPSRILIHTLNYVSQDYAGAVKDGKIISESEFKEQKEFGESAIKYFEECSGSWSKNDSAAIRLVIFRLDSLVEKHAPFQIVSSTALDARDKIIAASGLKISPSTYPSLDNGKVVFKTECAKCHGDNGFGDGPEGKDLNPKPKNFHDDEKISPLSPFFVFNTVRLGVEGTGMKAHPTLEDDDVWDVAFYVLTLRYQQLKNAEALKMPAIRELADSIPLDKIATSSDQDFRQTYKTLDSNKLRILLAAIRYNQPKADSKGFISTSLKYLEGAMQLYNEGKFHEASELATMSYLEGIEPIEMQLKSNDPQLMSTLEDQLHGLSKLMDERRPAVEIQDSLNAARKSIKQAGDLLEKKEYSFMLALLMAVSILLREGLEAFLVIMVILSILKATHLKKGVWWIHAGWILAIVAGIVIWVASGTIINSQMEHMELMEGFVSLLAVFMLLYIGFWLHGKSEAGKWKDYVTRKMKGAVTNESMIGLAGLSFFVVFREVFESVLFLSALNVEAGGKQGEAIVFGVILAFVLVIAFAFIVIGFSARLPIPKLFKISSLVMGLLAIVLAGKGIHSLQETGHASIHGLPLFRFELFGIFPTVETCIAQAAVAIIITIIWNMGTGAKPSKQQ